jgi:hypothetical protein
VLKARGATNQNAGMQPRSLGQGHPLQDGVVTAQVRAPHPAGVVEVCEGPFEQLAASA